MRKKQKTTTILFFDFVINSLLTVVELVMGTISNSTALQADGFQNLTDSIVLTVAFITDCLTRRRGMPKKSKANVYRIAGSSNAVVLIILSIYVGFNSIHRIFNPQPVDSRLVIWVGVASVVVNWSAAKLLAGRRKQKEIRAPYLGLIFSGISGVGVLVSGLIDEFAGVHIDGLVGLIIAVTLLLRSCGLFRKAASGS